MKTGIKSAPNIVSEDMEESVMGMDAHGMDMATYFLRDKIYNNKVLACVREYICNALDEHKHHDVSVPVECFLILDKDGKWLFKVRDYALGLDDNGVRKIFGMYFKSTKSDTNDLIGGFGIGSKAFHAYTDTFYVVSHHNGIKTTYSCMLGAGKMGVEVGKIYELGKEPTTESGIEIYADVSADGYNFSQTATKFVQNLPPDTNIIFYNDWTGQTISPHVAKSILNLSDNVTLTFYQNTDNVNRWNYNNKTVDIRMGGVVYTSRTVYKLAYDFVDRVVVDVPVGTFTIPVSRENIEEKPHNEKQFDKIFEDIVKLSTLDLEKSSSNVFDILNEIRTYGLGYRGNASKVAGEYFYFRLDQLTPKCNLFISHIKVADVLNYDTFVTHKDNKDKTLVIYVFPNIQNTTMWHRRLKAQLEKNPTFNGYCYIDERPWFDEFRDNTIVGDCDLSNIIFLKVKDMGLPKLPANKTPSSTRKYTVYNSWGGTKGYYTAEEWYDYLITTYNNGDDFDKVEFLKTTTSPNDLANWVVNIEDYYSSSAYRYNRTHITPKYYIRSKKMREDLVALGLPLSDDAEFIAAIKEIEKRETIKRELENLKDTLNGSYKFLNPMVHMHIINNPNKFEKIKTRLDTIKAEQSLRGKVLRSIDYYSSISSFNRDEIRRILTLK